MSISQPSQLHALAKAEKDALYRVPISINIYAFRLVLWEGDS